MLLACVLSTLLFALILPALRYRFSGSAFERGRWEVLVELVLSHTMGWFLLIWVFFFGACLGSFLNVVAYRIPSGLTILGSSRCPFCMVPIDGRNNIPIFGWLMLRGRCASCRLPISIRYVLVEIVAGLLLVWLFVFELVADGSNLPSGKSYRIQSLFRTLATGNLNDLALHDGSLVRIFFVHCLVGYTLLTAALMRLDRFKLPLIWKSAHLLIVIVWLAIWPTDFDFARSTFQTSERVPEFLRRVDFQLTGMLVGAFLGFQYCSIARDWSSGILFCFCLIGSSFGLSATISIGVIFLSLLAASGLFGLLKHSLRHPVFVLLLASLLQVALWSRLSGLAFWPNETANTITLFLFLVPGTIAVSWAQSLPLSTASSGDAADGAAPTEKSQMGTDEGRIVEEPDEQDPEHPDQPEHPDRPEPQ